MPLVGPPAFAATRVYPKRSLTTSARLAAGKEETNLYTSSSVARCLSRSIRSCTSLRFSSIHVATARSSASAPAAAAASLHKSVTTSMALA
eukprot:CAMPEP_0115197664 /NCGR_PEP_ID=MMETSP0270-20121206/15712_1 /TAXON_ID=71861 /ORGANISM="Scrippsiella trochoidea, Strain CCMP3099" /LENGTH=90 /DNA_ID=CAMNT_0002611023 /DNA_START=360 /DNA_END=632 /DNA_ORIENTATION=-